MEKAAVAAPVAIMVAMSLTGILGWIFNVVLVLCSGDINDLPGVSGLSVATIIHKNVGTNGFYILWVRNSRYLSYFSYRVEPQALLCLTVRDHAYQADLSDIDTGVLRCSELSLRSQHPHGLTDVCGDYRHASQL